MNKLALVLKLIAFILIFSLLIFFGIVVFNVKQQDKNLSILLNQDQNARFIPHKMNYLDKLEAGVRDKIPSAEFDMLFQTDPSGSSFQIGHSQKESSGYSFEDYLKKLQHYPMKKIWMDVKNVSDKNMDQILKRLNYLDEHYEIKHRILFETSTNTPALRIISNAGYQTSLYLPTFKILELILIEKNEKKIKAEAQRIKKLIEVQNLSAVSFEYKLYPFVKEYLEPIISKDTHYHTWSNVRMRYQTAIVDLQDLPYVQDERVKTIIYVYYHPLFHSLAQRLVKIFN